jgi:hypothetical protein
VVTSGEDSPRLVPYAHAIYHNRNRAYSPQLGRFMQRDPNGTAFALIEAAANHGRGMGAVALAFSMEDMYGDGLNLYEYLGSNTWGRSDPMGLSWDPFDIVDDYLAESAGSTAAFLNQLGQDAKAVAVVSATIASYLPFPFVGSMGDLALYALGEQGAGETAAYLALGIIPGGKLMHLAAKSKLGSFLGKIGVSAWRGAKHYASKYGRAIIQAVGSVTPLGLAKRALEFLKRKPSVACGCFTAGTVVWTATGLVPIEQVEIGDLVLVRDEATGQVSYEEVTAEIVTRNTALLELRLVHVDGRREVVKTTDEHPFRLVEDSGDTRWVRADALASGAAIQTLAGTARVESVSYPGGRTTVYNLSVAGSPNYFVGPDGVWVHNCKIVNNIGQHALKPDHNWHRMFGSTPSLDEVQQVLMDVAQTGTHGMFKEHGAEGFSSILTKQVNGHEVWASVFLGKDNVLKVTNGGIN